MNMMKQAAAAVVIIGSAIAYGSAMAQDVKIGIGFPLSPGHNGANAGGSPGQVFNEARKGDPAAPSPGQFYILNRNSETTPALPPGQNVQNHGRSTKK
jgi:hypothetical protein